MIVDNIKNCDLYYEINEKMEQAFDFIKKAVNEKLPAGKYEIDGCNLYASVQEYTTKHHSECKFEGHRRYIDIQYIISGTEIIEVVDVSKAVSDVAYNEEIDAEFFENNSKAGSIVLESGEYAVFYPNDIHKPAMVFGDTPQPIKKIVVKVRV